MKKYLIFDLDGTLIDSGSKIDTIILGEIDRIAPDYHDSVRYALGHSGGMSLSQFLDSVFQDMEVVQKERLKNKLLIQLNSLSNAVGFFPGVPEMIQELSQTYRLFLSTGSSTEFATEVLHKGEIDSCFDIIEGSTILLKGISHLEKFFEFSGDPDFYKQAVYIGDGDMDRVFAESKGIDFVHIGNSGTDLYEIDIVTKLPPLLEQL